MLTLVERQDCFTPCGTDGNSDFSLAFFFSVLAVMQNDRWLIEQQPTGMQFESLPVPDGLHVVRGEMQRLL